MTNIKFEIYQSEDKNTFYLLFIFPLKNTCNKTTPQFTTPFSLAPHSPPPWCNWIEFKFIYSQTFNHRWIIVTNKRLQYILLVVSRRSTLEHHCHNVWAFCRSKSFLVAVYTTHFSEGFCVFILSHHNIIGWTIGVNKGRCVTLKYSSILINVNRKRRVYSVMTIKWSSYRVVPL